MTIASELEALQTNLNNAYTAIENKGGTLPEVRSFENLSLTITDMPSSATLVTKTITENGTYNASSDSADGYSEVTVNVPGVDIITAKNTTSSAIAEGDKVWLEKVVGGWNIIKLPNNIQDFSLNGSPSIDSSTHVINNFSNSSGIVLNKPFNFSQPWFFRTKVVTGDSWGTDGNQFIYTGNSSSSSTMYNSGFSIWLRNREFSFTVQLSSSLGTTNILFNKTPSLNTLYYIEVGWTGMEYYAKYSTDGENWIESGDRIQSTEVTEQSLNSFVIGFCKLVTSYYWHGSIYLDETYLNIGGVTIWKPYPSLMYRAEGCFSGFAEEAIAVSGIGNVKTALGNYINIEVTADADDAEISVE